MDVRGVAIALHDLGLALGALVASAVLSCARPLHSMSKPWKLTNHIAHSSAASRELDWQQMVVHTIKLRREPDAGPTMTSPNFHWACPGRGGISDHRRHGPVMPERPG